MTQAVAVAVGAVVQRVLAATDAEGGAALACMAALGCLVHFESLLSTGALMAGGR